MLSAFVFFFLFGVMDTISSSCTGRFYSRYGSAFHCRIKDGNLSPLVFSSGRTYWRQTKSFYFFGLVIACWMWGDLCVCNNHACGSNFASSRHHYLFLVSLEVLQETRRILHQNWREHFSLKCSQLENGTSGVFVMVVSSRSPKAYFTFDAFVLNFCSLFCLYLEWFGLACLDILENRWLEGYIADRTW